jgi:hypothetical protein
VVMMTSSLQWRGWNCYQFIYFDADMSASFLRGT